MWIETAADADLDPDARRDLAALTAAIYPPEVIPTLPGSDLTWARAERHLIVRDDGHLAAHIGC